VEILTCRQAWREFADILNRVAYRREQFLLTRHGRPVAVLVPVVEPEHLDEKPRAKERT